MSADTYLFPIGSVSTMTGVSTMTLRAWESRHQLIAPQRTPGGHRLYSQADIDRIHRIVALIAEGYAVSQLGPVLAQQSSTGPARLAGPEPVVAASAIWNEWCEKLIAAVADFDEQRLDAIYQRMLALHPADRVLHEALLPVLATLGARWESDSCSIADEHFFATFLRNKLGAQLHHRSAVRDGPKLLLACLPGERHDSGLLLVGLRAHDLGFRVAMLGADMPIVPLAVVVKRASIDAVVLSGSVTPSPETLRRDLAQLVREAGVPIFVGGLTAITYRDVIVAAGAIPVGVDIGPGLKLIEQRLVESIG